jgi:hypothetical protein
MVQLVSHWRIFMKCDIWVFLENLLQKFKRRWNRTKMKVTLHEDQYTFLSMSLWILLIMKDILDKIRRKTRNTYYMFNNFFFGNRAVYEIMWKNIVERGRLRRTWRMRIACWIPKATNTLRLCNIHCFLTATMVAQTRLSITLYLNWLFCLYSQFWHKFESLTLIVKHRLRIFENRVLKKKFLILIGKK